MSTTPAQIDDWLCSPSELPELEFKEARDSFSLEKLFQYCAAIHNELGGKLILGVSDKHPRRVVGSSAFQNPIKAVQQILDKLHFRVDIEEVNHPQGRILVFHIPPRPVGTPCSLDGAFFMRSGESLVAMTPDHLRAIFDEGKPEWLEEHTGTGLDDSQVVDLLDTQSFFELIRLPYPTDRAGVIQRLIEMKLVDRINGGYAIRRMGALLLAKRLDRFSELERKAPRVITYSGNSKMETNADFPGNKGYAVGFDGLVGFVSNLLPQNETMEGALRVSVKLVPDDAIRELLANALIHQDFMLTGTSMTVEIYANRVEISNPGEPIVAVERFIDGCQSRNERFASLMRRFGACEEKGSGIDRVVKMAEIYQLPAPDFRTGLNSTIVTIFGGRKFEQMDRQDRVRACYQHCALKWVMSEKMTNESLRERFKLSRAKTSIASQIISQTIESGLIRADTVGGSRKYARYAPFWA
ncbi:MAG TPA: ATP-binding protein [Terriglobia bacterium]|nr:ATP-binding protein [Terriglobia bacterium]